MPKILLIALTPFALGGLGAAYILGLYALCKRLRLSTSGPWFAAGTVGSFAALLYLIALRL